MRSVQALALAASAVSYVAANDITLLVRQETALSAAPSITAVSDCHLHGTVQYCVAGTAEYQMNVSPTSGEVLPTEYSGCHSHSTTYCQNPEGEDIQVLVGASLEEPETPAAETGTSETISEEDCHFHAGIQHCVDGAEEEGASTQNCSRRDRDYNIPLRIGLLFVILITSATGVFAPIILSRLPVLPHTDVVLLVLKHFGTGVIISTAFVHLFTHAQLMFSNECLGELNYEATTAAVVMAGIFISFLVEYIGRRFARSKVMGIEGATEQSDGSTHASKNGSDSSPPVEVERIGHHGHAADTVGVTVMEAGVIFHSILIGITLVVAGDSFFITLFIVIVFHQFFEGIALGTCIAALSSMPLLKKTLMAGAFALVTPIGMAIGIGVLNHFNGNDPSTIIAIGTLDAFSAGILVWVGVVEMLAADWFNGGPLVNAPIGRVLTAGIALVIGMVLMGLLGKWA
ncbi:hypothetical protein LTS18_007598 [Coniosporium uncinatum]|uniref:Uncharacterized protein n=1 Tax=Coniosporium uncinatum TaxID=93489 RepID=A0ACC3DAR9_9PEZI|nr:hypothetical protein LTS18_007598 [Coniosporium uncinatum]